MFEEQNADGKKDKKGGKKKKGKKDKKGKSILDVRKHKSSDIEEDLEKGASLQPVSVDMEEYKDKQKLKKEKKKREKEEKKKKKKRVVVDIRVKCAKSNEMVLVSLNPYANNSTV